MRGNIHILALFGIILVLAALLVFLLQPQLSPARLSESLSAKDTLRLEQAGEAIDNDDFAKAKDLLSGIKNTTNLHLRLLRAMVQTTGQGLPPTDIRELEQEVSRDRGLARIYDLSRLREIRKEFDQALGLHQELLAAKFSEAFHKRVAKRFAAIPLEQADRKAATAVFLLLCEKQLPPGLPTAGTLLDLLAKDQLWKEYDDIAQWAEKQQPSAAELLAQIAGHRVTQKKAPEAIRLYERSLKLNPSLEPALWGLFQLYRDGGKTDAAFQVLERACTLPGAALAAASQAVVLRRAAVASYQGGNLNRAASLLRKAAIRDLKPVLALDGKMLSDLTNPALSGNSAEEQALQHIFRSYLDGDFAAVEAGYPQAARAISTPALRADLDQLRESCRLILARDKAFADKEAAALLAARKTPDQPPKPPVSVNPKPVAQPATGGGNTVPELIATCVNNPDRPDLVCQAGEKLFHLNESMEAQKAFEAVLQRYPKHPVALFGLARIMKLRNKIPEAAELIEKAIALNPKELRFHATYALILIEKGELDQGGNEAKIAYYDNPKNQEAHLAMARWHATNGDSGEAYHFIELGLNAEEPSPLMTTLFKELQAQMEAAGLGKTAGS